MRNRCPDGDRSAPDGRPGWDIFDKSQVSTEEPTSDGRADYFLKDTLTRPLAIIEAKRFSNDPYSDYATVAGLTVFTANETVLGDARIGKLVTR